MQLRSETSEAHQRSVNLEDIDPLQHQDTQRARLIRDEQPLEPESPAGAFNGGCEVVQPDHRLYGRLLAKPIRIAPASSKQDHPAWYNSFQMEFKG